MTHNKERKDKHKESRWCISFFSLCSLLWPLPTIRALDTGYCMWLCVLKRFSEKKILTSLGHCNESFSPVRVTLESPSQLMHRSASAPGAITHSIFPTQELIYKSSTFNTVIGKYYWNDCPLSVWNKSPKILFKKALYLYLTQYLLI